MSTAEATPHDAAGPGGSAPPLLSRNLPLLGHLLELPVHVGHLLREIAQRLGALGSKVAFANIPSVTSIGFLLDGEDLIRLLGSDYGLAEGSRTTVVTMLLIKLGLDDGSLISNPDYVLDAGEIATIDERVEEVVAGKRQIADITLPKSSSIGDLDAAQLQQALGIDAGAMLDSDPITDEGLDTGVVLT